MTARAPVIRELPWRLSPHDVLARWPRSVPPSHAPLTCLISASGAAEARWSIFARPTRAISIPAAGDPLRRLDELTASTRFDLDTPLPFVGGWLAAISYDLGRIIEPSARHPDADPARPDNFPGAVIELHRCDAALLHDAREHRWYAVGDSNPELDPADTDHEALAVVHDLRSDTGEDEYRRRVARCIQLIHAGDVFQVNLAHQLLGRLEGSPRALMRRMLERAEPGFGAYLESPGGAALCSISPELFLELDLANRQIMTRPIKGTRPAAAGADRELAAAEKDRAELAMIVDLMRNDLGRVCDYGSIRVTDPRSIDRHGRAQGALLHASATIRGTLRTGVSLAAVLAATFPPGSVTGAPKVRAMQIIDELETSRRGHYCGAIGYISDHGRAAFSVAIRTASITPAGDISFPVGAGIVADSDPKAEWDETLAKAQMFFSAVHAAEAAR